jgi:hypothetical protein
VIVSFQPHDNTTLNSATLNNVFNFIFVFKQRDSYTQC